MNFVVSRGMLDFTTQCKVKRANKKKQIPSRALGVRRYIYTRSLKRLSPKILLFSHSQGSWGICVLRKNSVYSEYENEAFFLLEKNENFPFFSRERLSSDGLSFSLLSSDLWFIERTISVIPQQINKTPKVISWLMPVEAAQHRERA